METCERCGCECADGETVRLKARSLFSCGKCRNESPDHAPVTEAVQPKVEALDAPAKKTKRRSD